MFRLIISALVLTSLITIAACKKESAVPQKRYWLVNKNGAPIRVNLYNTKLDYESNSNVVYSITVPAKGKDTFPSVLASEGKPIYFDYYSLDSNISNWPSYQYPNLQDTRPFANDTAYLEYGAGGTWQRVFLAWDKHQTIWKPVFSYAFDDQPNWDERTEAERSRRLTIRKNLTATYQYRVPGVPDVIEETLNHVTGTYNGDGLFGMIMSKEMNDWIRTYYVYGTALPTTHMELLLLQWTQ